MLYRGYDCSWDPPDQQCMKDAGYQFLVRYSSQDPSKNLTRAELDSALSRGLSVCVVYQEGKSQMTRGYSGGQADARTADSFTAGLGMAGIPLYFSCDYDPPSGDWPAIDGYLDGVASVIGRSRTGGYGGLPFIQRQFGSGRITYGWQTYAWSGGSWDSRAQLRQVKNDFAKCGGTIDDDEAWASDYGQWPRPGGAPGTGDYMPSSAYYDGKLHLACVWTDGRVNYKREDQPSWVAVDANRSATAKSGADIIVTPSGTIIITYTSQAGKVCTYQKPASAPQDASYWSWYDRGGSARLPGRRTSSPAPPAARTSRSWTAG